MKVGKIILISLALAAVSFGQIFELGQDVSNENGNKFLASDSDSVYWSGDSLYIFGDDTAFIFINSGRTLGMLTYKGYVETVNDSAIVYFDIAKHRGVRYDTLDSYLTNTYIAMDTCTVDSNSAQGFYFSPLQSTSLQDYNHSYYYVLRIYGVTGYWGRIWIKEERSRAF